MLNSGITISKEAFPRLRANPTQPDDIQDLREHEVSQSEFFFEDGGVCFDRLFGGAECGGQDGVIFVCHREQVRSYAAFESA